jgi:hypothetical protein
LWAAIGALVFLVAHQASLLVGGRFLGVGPVTAIAVVVFATTGVAAYSLEGRLPKRGGSGGGTTEELGNSRGDGAVEGPEPDEESRG